MIDAVVVSVQAFIGVPIWASLVNVFKLCSKTEATNEEEEIEETPVKTPTEKISTFNESDFDSRKKSAANESEYFTAEELSALVQESLGRERFVSQDIGTGEELGNPLTDLELNELLGSAFRGADPITLKALSGLTVKGQPDNS